MTQQPHPTNQPRKIGEGHAQAMLRQGLKELQSAMYTGSNVARDAEPGTFGSPTQGEIAAGRRPDQSPSILDTHTQNAKAQRDQGHMRSDGPEHEGPERE